MNGEDPINATALNNESGEKKKKKKVRMIFINVHAFIIKVKEHDFGIITLET